MRFNFLPTPYNLAGGRIAWVFFCTAGGRLVLLHGFIKKTQKTPDRELKIAHQRLKGEKT